MQESHEAEKIQQALSKDGDKERNRGEGKDAENIELL
jgi:hypothetical protein